MAIFYAKPLKNQDGTRMNYQQRRAARRTADAERRAQEKQEPITRESIYDLPYADRRGLRRAEAQGRREAEQRAVIEEASRKQAEYDALPDHEKRPRNPWLDLIELRKPDAWRKDVARRIKVYEREARLEDERIDSLMAERKKRHEVESSSEHAQALAHWERGHVAAESDEERQEWARLKSIVDAYPNDYWHEVAPIMQGRLQKLQERWNEQLAKQAAVVEESKAVAAEVEAVSELQVTPQEVEQ